MPENGLAGKVIVITGASSGFGKGAAKEFAHGGARVVLAARRGDLLEDVAAECKNLSGEAMVVPTDVSSAEEVAALADAAVSQHHHIDVWVNNAGVGALGRFEDIPLADHVKVIETDLLGTLFGSYYAMQQFRRQSQGTLINIASVVGKIPTPYYSSYAAAKHGVVWLSASLRQELKLCGLENIHVCTVMPTSFDTPFFEHAANYTGHKTEPIPPVYEPEEVVETIVRLAIDPTDEVTIGTAAGYMTFLHQIVPGLTENIMGKNTHEAQIEKAPPASATSGSVHEPTAKGTDVKRRA